MAGGLADDLATTALLATDKPVMVAPAMNVRMWEHPATQANLRTLEARGVVRVGPGEGDMACGEFGPGRMAEPAEIVAALDDFFRTHSAPGRLRGIKALVTSGPTHEAIDPVRFMANRSSGKQGHAIATALAELGAATTLVSGPTARPDPRGVTVVHVESAADMLAACEAALPVDVAVAAAAVSDWRVAAPATAKIKKDGGDGKPPALILVENPDILARLGGAGNRRPRLLIGFAAETENVIDNATAKRTAKGCDWIIANDVSAAQGTFGGDDNTVHMVTADGAESWPRLTKQAVAQRLAGRIAEALAAAP
jgi:phosphopantothenoylcysteine decarboxylase/phosphopantothenate--cysteine ligase